MDETLSSYATDTQEASTTDTRDTQSVSGHPLEQARGAGSLGDGSAHTINQAKDADKGSGRDVTPPIDTSDDDKWREQERRAGLCTTWLTLSIASDCSDQLECNWKGSIRSRSSHTGELL